MLVISGKGKPKPSAQAAEFKQHVAESKSEVAEKLREVGED